jgi:pyruvate,orthophosphate dikinase
MYPEIAIMQTRAVVRAAINVMKRNPGLVIQPEIMIPLIGSKRELRYVKKIVRQTCIEEGDKAQMRFKYQIGTMIEIPRAALIADEIATEADFFCFGTNDLTQMTYGYSRDDSGKFLKAYMDAKILEFDPFAKLDPVGVGKLMRIAVEAAARPTRLFTAVSAVSTAAIRLPSSSSTPSVLTMSPARRSAFRSRDWLRLRLPSAKAT